MQREEIIRQVVQRDLEHRPLREEQVLRESPELYAAACEHFGTWDTALHYAGINLRRRTTESAHSDQDVLRTIRYLCRNGYNLTAHHNLKRDRRLYEAAREHFGTWRRALCAAGINTQHANLPPHVRRLSKPQIIEAIQHRHHAGLSLSWAVICLENRALAHAAKNRFRSWRQALAAAGLGPGKTPPTDGQPAPPEH